MKRILIAIVTLALLLAAVGVISAQDNTWRKTIAHIFWYYRTVSETTDGAVLNMLCVMWDDPHKAPTDYRLSWTKRKHGWRSIEKPNTTTAGNAIVIGNRYCIGAEDPVLDAWNWHYAKTDGSLAVPEGATLSVRVRARYPGKNGPWTAKAAKVRVKSPG